jgi:hypothetical protein
MCRRYRYSNISRRSHAIRSISDNESRQGNCAVERKAAEGVNTSRSRWRSSSDAILAPTEKLG